MDLENSQFLSPCTNMWLICHTSTSITLHKLWLLLVLPCWLTKSPWCYHWLCPHCRDFCPHYRGIWTTPVPMQLPSIDSNSAKKHSVLRW